MPKQKKVPTLKQTFSDFFGQQGKCATCDANCDDDRLLCALCLNKALVESRAKNNQQEPK